MNTQYLLLYTGLMGFLVLMMIVPKRRQQKKTENMQKALAVGDEIFTVGGIIGTIMKVQDDEITVETGSDKNKIRFKRWAVGGLLNEKLAKKK